MKTHRNILFISITITIISLIFVIILNTDGKCFQITLAFMGSSFISFLLELPNYISLKEENNNKLYYYLNEVKNQSSLLKNSIENALKAYNSITDKFYDQNIEKISISLYQLKTFDPNYHLTKKKNYQVFNIFNIITNSFNNLDQSTRKFKMDFNKKKIEILTIEKKDRNISPIELSNSLKCMIEMCTNLINTTNKQASLLLSKRKMIQWNIDDMILQNVINSFNIDN